MTADEFDMKPHTFMGDHEWRFKVRDGDLKIEFDVYDDVFQESLKDNWDYICDTAAKEMADRVLNLWDDGKITDNQKQTFIDILRMVIG